MTEKDNELEQEVPATPEEAENETDQNLDEQAENPAPENKEEQEAPEVLNKTPFDNKEDAPVINEEEASPEKEEEPAAPEVLDETPFDDKEDALVINEEEASFEESEAVEEEPAPEPEVVVAHDDFDWGKHRERT